MRNYHLPEWQENLALLQASFVEFLTSNNVLELFTIYAPGGFTNAPYFFDEIGQAAFYPQSWVICAFQFKQTAEGVEFWEVIDNLWLEQLQKDNEI